MNKCSTFSIALDLKSHIKCRLVAYAVQSLNAALSLCKDAVVIFYNCSTLGLNIWGYWIEVNIIRRIKYTYANIYIRLIPCVAYNILANIIELANVCWICLFLFDIVVHTHTLSLSLSLSLSHTHTYTHTHTHIYIYKLDGNYARMLWAILNKTWM